MPQYQAKDNVVLGRQLKVQRLVLPFTVTGGNGTPANVSFVADDPAIAFFKSASVDQITGALSTNETLPTYTTTDASGIFGALVVVNEVVGKVLNAQIVDRKANSVCYANVTGTPAGGITVGTGSLTYGQKIALQCKIPTDLTSSSTFDGALIVEYQTSK
jgi:hypothetical protein